MGSNTRRAQNRSRNHHFQGEGRDEGSENVHANDVAKLRS